MTELLIEVPADLPQADLDWLQAHAGGAVVVREQPTVDPTPDPELRLEVLR